MSAYNLILKAIEEELEKCTPKYISALPYSLRSNNWNELKERYLACESEMMKRENHIDDLKSAISNNLKEIEEDVENVKVRKRKYNQMRKDGDRTKEYLDEYKGITDDLIKDIKDRNANVDKWIKEGRKARKEWENLNEESEKVARKCDKLRMI